MHPQETNWNEPHVHKQWRYFNKANQILRIWYYKKKKKSFFFNKKNGYYIKKSSSFFSLWILYKPNIYLFIYFPSNTPNGNANDFLYASYRKSSL